MNLHRSSGRDGDLEQALLEMTYHPLLELADQFSGEADVRRKEEGDAGPFLKRLVEFLEGIDHAVSGGLAMRAYLRERPTMDFDVLVSEKAWETVKEFIRVESLELASSAGDIYGYQVPGTRMALDVLVARSPLWKEALADTVVKDVFGRALRILKPDSLAAMKVKSYSERKEYPDGDRDRKDVLRLLAMKLACEDRVREILLRNRPDLLPELEQILGSRPA